MIQIVFLDGRLRPHGVEKLLLGDQSPGILDEKMHLYLATGLREGATAREEGEEIENLVVPWPQAIDMVFRGEIKDAKSIVGLLWVDRNRRKS